MKKNLQLSDLNINPVNSNSPIPLYHQIESDLRRMINQGIISQSDVLPPELELSKAYGVGRHTMREALSRLVADQIITRRAGMGTVVNPIHDRAKFYLNRSFTSQMAEMGRSSHSQVLDSHKGILDESHPAIFHDQIGEPYFFLQRLRLGDNEAIGIQSVLLVSRQCPQIEKYNFAENSLYDILSREYNIIITEIQHTITAEKADELQSELLNIAEGDPLLLVRTLAFTEKRNLIELTSSYYRADRYEYSTTATFL